MTNQAYDRLKICALIAAPVSVFVAALCAAWDIPHADAICATLAAVDALLGSVVEILRKNYNKDN